MSDGVEEYLLMMARSDSDRQEIVSSEAVKCAERGVASTSETRRVADELQRLKPNVNIAPVTTGQRLH